MKKILLVSAIIISIFSACLTWQGASRFMSGVWKGSAAGYGGTIILSVETNATSILDIRVTEHNEDPFIGGEAIRELIEAVLEEDSTDVDAVTGATITSAGFLEAVDRALLSAKLIPAQTAIAPTAPAGAKIETVQNPVDETPKDAEYAEIEEIVKITEIEMIAEVTETEKIEESVDAINDVSPKPQPTSPVAANDIAHNDDRQLIADALQMFAMAPVLAEETPAAPNEDQKAANKEAAKNKKTKGGLKQWFSKFFLKFGELYRKAKN